MVIYKRSRRGELGTTEKQLQLVVRTGLEPATFGFQVRRPNHSAMKKNNISVNCSSVLFMGCIF